MSKYIAQPGERIVWCLRRRASDVRCVLHPDAMPVEVHVVQDRDLVLTELFPEESIALKWSRAYAERLRRQGWHDSLDE